MITEKSCGGDVKMQKKKFHYAWMILAGCCILQGASLGLINNCAGVFFSPVCENLGFEMGSFSLYRMLFSLSSAFALPFVAVSLKKLDIRFVISAAAVICGVCNMAMGTFTELWQWYVTGAVQGAASAFLCMVPAPIILGNWFHKKTGMAVGISAAFSGLMGMMGSSGLGFSIPAFGWRASYMGMGILIMGFILPTAIFILRYQPEDKGLRPYGAEENEAVHAGALSGTKEKDSIFVFLRQPFFYIALTAYACSIASSYLNMFLTSCGITAGLTLTMAAMLTTLSLFGNMFSKLFLGKASDTYGVVRVLEVSVLIAIAGHVLLFLGHPAAAMAGALLFGITPPLSSVMLPLFCRLYWKGETYGTAYSYVSMAGMLFSAPFSALFGRFYDITGTYKLTIAVSGMFVLLVLVMAKLGERTVKASRLQEK